MSLPELATWYQAGFGDRGDIGRSSLDGAPWVAPRAVHVDGGRLYWDDGAERLPDGGRRYVAGCGGRIVQAGPDIFGRFLDTWDDDSGELICEFATTFGVLKLCSRGLPVGHVRPGQYAGGPHDDCFSPGWPEGEPYVELASWRLWARRAMGLLNIAAKLQRSELPDPEDWAVQSGRPLQRRPPGFEPLGWRQTSDLEEIISLERSIAADLVNEWLALGGVRLEARWENGATTPTARAAGDGLFGALALQLLLTTAKSEGLAICSACGLTYAPTRKPPAGRDHYCQSCGKAAARREATRRYRAKKRSEKG